MSVSYRFERFFSSSITSELIQKLHSSGIVGTWAVPTASMQWWRFANGDFVFATIGQIHGILGITCLLLLFLSFSYFGLQAVIRSDNRFNAILVLSMTTLILTGVLLSSLVGCGAVGGLGHITIPFFTYGGVDLILGAVGAGLIFKQLRLKQVINPFQINVRRLFLIMAGLALIIWLKTVFSML
jgi:cell division protein FtsW (lipid II flippase)